jgi:hypothetical protein
MTKMEHLSTILRDAEAALLGKNELCEMAGISRTTLFRAEQDPECMSSKTIKKLRAAVKVAQRENVKAA